MPNGDDRRVFPSRGFDTGRGATPHVDDPYVLSSLLRTLAGEGGTLALYAYEIAPVGDGNYIHPDRLTAILREAHRLGLDMLGFDEV